MPWGRFLGCFPRTPLGSLAWVWQVLKQVLEPYKYDKLAASGPHTSFGCEFDMFDLEHLFQFPDETINPEAEAMLTAITTLSGRAGI